MPSSFTIPEKRREGFAVIARLNKESVQELSQCLAQIPVKLFDRESIIHEVVSANLKLIDVKNVTSVVETILSLFFPFIESGKPIQAFLAEILDAIDESINSKDLILNDDERRNLAENLLSLLSVQSIGLAAKASSVMFENERSFLSSKVICEIRPIFEMEKDTIGGAVIVHTLRIEYFKKANDDQEEFYIQLDDDDIDDLIFKLERTKSKSTKIKEMLSASSIPHIDGKN
jgi:hypothetical protein